MQSALITRQSFLALPPLDVVMADLHSQCSTLSRRGFVQAGFSSVLGLGLASVLSGQARAETSKPRKTKSLIVIFLNGGASHHDPFDMKPDAPVEIRGQFNPIATSAPGVQICELLPRLAKQMH